MRSRSLPRSTSEISTPLRLGKRPRGDESGPCERTKRHLRSSAVPQKKFHLTSGSTRFAFIESRLSGGRMSFQGSSLIVAAHFIFVGILSVVLAQPRRVDDILHAIFVKRRR